MTSKQAGYLILIAALGMLFVSMGPEIQKLHTWSEFFTPTFIGVLVVHIGSVIGAYVGGRITPTDRQS